jgi:prevent-host-death family protein
MQTISATDARNNIGKLWETASREPVTVESAGKPIVVVISPETYNKLTGVLRPRQAGCAKHLLSGAGIDVNELLSISVEDAFEDYM